MSGRLEGKVALVTGASRGIGQAIAEALAKEGAAVAMAARKPEALGEAAEKIASAGGKAVAIPANIGRPEAREELLAKTRETLGPVDVLVNNAAANPYFGPFLGVSDEAFRKTFEVNIDAPFALSRAVALDLRERGAAGSLIMVSSVLGTTAAPLQGVYGMTKAALISMVRTLAAELGRDGIRANAIAPGLIETRFAGALVENDEIRGRVERATALGRVGAPEDIGGAAVFLACDEAQYVTGQVLTVDGGLTLGGI